MKCFDEEEFLVIGTSRGEKAPIALLRAKRLTDWNMPAQRWSLSPIPPEKSSGAKFAQDSRAGSVPVAKDRLESARISRKHDDLGINPGLKLGDEGLKLSKPPR